MWNTAEDVCSNLQAVGHVNSSSLKIVRDKPPAIKVNEDEEIEALCNQLTGGQHPSNAKDNDAPKPDLVNISMMLQMVKNETNSTEDRTKNDVLEIRKAPNLLPGSSCRKLENYAPESISKRKNIQGINKYSLGESKNATQLNPSVPEFIPNSTKLHNETPEYNNDLQTEIIDVNTKIDYDNLKSDQIQALIKSFKLIVDDASKSSSFEQKLLKNKAYAVLTKLYSLSDTQKQGKELTKVKLLTPNDFFQTKENLALLQCKVDVNLPFNLPKVSHTAETKTASGENSPPKDALNKCIEKKIEVGEVSVKEREESIKKVESWLEGPLKQKLSKPVPKSPAVLGPIIFKKKVKTPAGSCTDVSVVTTTPVKTSEEPANQDYASKQYEPSQNVQQLYKKYLERDEQMRAQKLKRETPMERLYRELDEKDMAYKKEYQRKQEQAKK